MKKFLFVLLVIAIVVLAVITDQPPKKPCDCGDICSKSPSGYSCGLNECPDTRR